MNKKVFRNQKRTLLGRKLLPSRTAGVHLALLVLFAAAGVTGILQQQQAYAAAKTAASYCGVYTNTNEASACKDGVNGGDCNDYAIILGAAVADICYKAAKDRDAGIVSAGNVTVPSGETPAPPLPSSPTKPNLNQILDSLDQTKDLDEYLDLLHEAGPNAEEDVKEVPDDTKGQYINGAGKKQSIVELNHAGPDAPTILFFNGGGWHANDLNGQKITGMYPGFEGGKDNEDRYPTGGTAQERGFNTYDVTYRLGSSGVYYMFEDVMRGIKHMRENADLYNIDPEKIILWGDSSGGSLAMRAAASGKSGAKVAVGWSPPTNAYTGLFRSYKSLLIGMDHSTCIPTDLAGLTNTTDLLTGGSGEVAEYGQGFSANDFSGAGIGLGGSSGIGMDAGKVDFMTTITDVLSAGQYAMDASQNVESITSQLESGGIMSLSGGVINLASKKFLECIDNFNALSPAMFASPETPPSFLAGFNTDDVVGPNQVTGMRDKLRTLGIRSDAALLDGTPGGNMPLTPNMGHHLDYDARFVCVTLNFILQELEEGGLVECETGLLGETNTDDGSGIADTLNGAAGGGSSGAGGGSSAGGGSGGGGGNSGGGGNTGGSSNTPKPACDSEGYQIQGVAGVCPRGPRPSATVAQKDACAKEGLQWVALTRGSGYCLRPTAEEKSKGYYSASYVKSGDSGRYTCPKGGTLVNLRCKL